MRINDYKKYIAITILLMVFLAGVQVGKNTKKKQLVKVSDLNIANNVIIKNSNWKILFDGTSQEVKQSRYYDAEIKEIAGCEDTENYICIFINE